MHDKNYINGMLTIAIFVKTNLVDVFFILVILFCHYDII